MKIMRAVDQLTKEGKSYQICYKGRPVVDITLEEGDMLTLSQAHEIAEEILHSQRPNFPVKLSMVSFTEIH